jgi:hypothetical protein
MLTKLRFKFRIIAAYSRREPRVPIFDDIISPKLVWPVESKWPLRRANALIERFRSKFTTIHYDLDWETRLLNAQAFPVREGPCVRLYGGLGRHRKVGIEVWLSPWHTK